MPAMHASYPSGLIELAPQCRPKILLLGANGQVGWELCRSLQPLGELIALGRAECDLAQPRQVRKVVRDIQPQLIVNAAAYTAVDKAEAERDAAIAANAVAPGILAEEADRCDAALVHYSTDYVFDGSGDHSWREEDPTCPLNHYGASKLAGEQAIAAVGVPHLILRTSWVYGLHGANFVKTMLRLGSQRAELSIVDDQSGAPTSARVIADITAQTLAQGRDDWATFFQDHGGIVHLACAGCTNWHAFAERIFAIAQGHGTSLTVRKLRPIPTSEYPTPARRPLNSRLCCDRLFNRFRLQAPSWETALEQSFPTSVSSCTTSKAA